MEFDVVNKTQNIGNTSVWICYFYGLVSGYLYFNCLSLSFYPESDKAAILSWTTFLLSFLFIVCACNIAVYGEKFEREISLYNSKTNRAASRNQRLTKTLLFVSAISVFSWLPLVIVNYLTVFHWVDIPNVFVDIINIVNFSRSILNPFIYALRIPQFRQTLVLCCSRRQGMGRVKKKEQISLPF